jgi:hypothetical protein
VTFRGPRGIEVAVSGFQPTEAFEEALSRAIGATSIADPPPELHDLLTRRGPLATAEVAEVYDELEDVTTLRLLDLEEAGRAHKIERAGGLFWSAKGGSGGSQSSD